MPRKAKTADELLRQKEKELDEREAMLDERDRLLLSMPEGELSSADIRQFFSLTRKDRLAAMFSIATKSPNERTRRDMLVRLDDMDIGKPSAKKRNDSEDVEGVIIQHGTYGIH